MVPLGISDLASEEGGRHLVGFVTDHQVPGAVTGVEQVLDRFVARQFVQTSDGQWCFHKPVAGAGGFQFVIGHDFEGQLESTVEFILPLLGQTPWAHHQTTLQVSPDDELFYQQPSHDGLAGPRVICQQEAEGLTWQHRLVYRRDLVGKRIYDRGMHRQDGVKEMSQTNTLRLGNEAEQITVAVK